MAQEYKVKAISQDEPRRWDGPHGIVHYIKVKLEGHDRAVEIGKKNPGALKVGDTVYGNIIGNEGYPTDRFKSEQNPNYAQGSKSGGTYSKLDNSDGQRQGMCFNNAANYVNSNESGLIPEAWAERVWEFANALYLMGDLGKGGLQGDVTSQATQEEKSEPAATNQEDELKFDDEEPINLDEIPF